MGVLLSRINCTKPKQAVLPDSGSVDRESCSGSVEDRVWNLLPHEPADFPVLPHTRRTGLLLLVQAEGRGGPRRHRGPNPWGACV